MKNLNQARLETKAAREYSTGLYIAGAMGLTWGAFVSIQPQLVFLIGLTLMLFGLAFDAFVFFSSVFELTWWERRLEARAQEWIAGSRARVDEAIANYEASRCAKAEARRVN